MRIPIIPVGGTTLGMFRMHTMRRDRKRKNRPSFMPIGPFALKGSERGKKGLKPMYVRQSMKKRMKT